MVDEINSSSYRTKPIRLGQTKASPKVRYVVCGCFGNFIESQCHITTNQTIIKTTKNYQIIDKSLNHKSIFQNNVIGSNYNNESLK